MQKCFAVIGGDRRNIFLAKALREDGHIVRMFGFSLYDKESVVEEDSLFSAITGAEYIIGGTPVSGNGINFNASYSPSSIFCDDVFRLIRAEQTFMGGYIRPEVLDMAKKYNVKTIDLLQYESLSILNAIPTAEGAVKIAIDETDITLHDSNILVMGFGRIGKMLCKILSSFSAKITVAVRSDEASALVKSYGYDVINSSRMNNRLHEFQIIFNTVPHILLDKTNLKFIKDNTLIIELASPPFGVDYEASKDFNIRVLFANSLPGIVAPKTVANYIKETIYSAIGGV